jgi:two-component system LytT family sensor kinase
LVEKIRLPHLNPTVLKAKDNNSFLHLFSGIMNGRAQNFNQRLVPLIHIILWLVVLAAHMTFFSQFLPFGTNLLRGLGNTLPMAGIFYINLWLVNRFFERGQYLWYFFAIFFVLMAFTGLRVQLNILFPQIDFDSRLIQDNYQQAWQIASFTTNMGIVLISMLFQIQQNRLKEEKRVQEILTSQNEAQLQFLRAQINPHFLFNTLNNIYSLAVVRSEKTSEMVLKLSNLLRYVIYEGKSKKVALQSEIEHIHEYIGLFRMRSESPLNITFEIKNQSDNILIEPMILIPIVENCFKHCDFDSNENAFVKIQLFVDNNKISFKTANSKNDDNKQKDQVGGVGTENIRKRLELKYPNMHKLEINDTGNIFTVHLEIEED